MNRHHLRILHSFLHFPYRVGLIHLLFYLLLHEFFDKALPGFDQMDKFFAARQLEYFAHDVAPAAKMTLLVEHTILSVFLIFGIF